MTDAPRLIASDVDGTLLTTDHRITPAVRRAVAAAREAGIPVVLASARGPRAMKGLLTELGTIDAGPFISFQGALVGQYLPDGGLRVVREHRLELAVALAIVRAAVSADATVNWYDTERWLVSRWDSYGEWEAKATGVTSHALLDLAEVERRGVGPHKLMIPPDRSRPELVPQLAASLPAGAVPHLSGEGYLEITTPGADKSHALAELCADLGIALEEVAAVGDGPNDLGMFDLVGVSVAMANASEAVRSRADLVTSTNDDDGLARAIDALLGRAELSPARP